ncbi:MAG TPA: ATP-grasp domain-containing protein [Jatrophihabitantaceae bacterium]|jgi:biotin carboxylase
MLLLQLIETSAGQRRFIWLVDRTTVEFEVWQRVLKRFGAVVDITGLSAAEAADQVAVHAPDGIIAFAEVELMRAASIGGHLGLAVQSEATVTRLTNKHAQRRALRAAGLPTPDFWAVPAGTGAAVQEAIRREVRYPAVVKPQSGAGSQGTDRVANAAELAQELEQAGNVDLLVEQMLQDSWPRAERPYADFVSVESILAGGRLSHLAVTGRSRLADPYRETGDFIPSNLPRETTDEIVRVAGRAIEAVQADTGVFHTEVKVTPDGPCVIEVNGRVGGSIPEIFALATDGAWSFLDIACRVALGEALHFDGPVPCQRVGYSIFEPPPLGATRVLRLDGLDEVRRVPGVDTLLINRRPGDAVDSREGYDARLYSVYGAADDHDAMWAARRRIKEIVVAEFAFG